MNTILLLIARLLSYVSIRLWTGANYPEIVMLAMERWSHKIATWSWAVRPSTCERSADS